MTVVKRKEKLYYENVEKIFRTYEHQSRYFSLLIELDPGFSKLSMKIEIVHLHLSQRQKKLNDSYFETNEISKLYK